MTFYFRLRVGHNNPLPLPKLSASSFFTVIEFGSDEESSFSLAIMFLPSTPKGMLPGAADSLILESKIVDFILDLILQVKKKKCFENFKRKKKRYNSKIFHRFHFDQ